MSKVGILGGTFDPIHLGHIQLAESVREQLKLQKVLFIPSHVPPHKLDYNVTDAKHRLAMVKLAVEEFDHFEASGYEVQKGGASYTIETAKHFRLKYPTTDFYFIIGEDNFSQVKQWKQFDQLNQLVTFAVANRNGFDGEEPKINCVRVSMPAMDISSSTIRELIQKKKSVESYLPKNVFDYIKKYSLYK